MYYKLIENIVVFTLKHTHFEDGRMFSFGRGRGVSFRAGAESMSQFKVDTTIAFLSLFPRSRITEIGEKIC